MPIHQKKEAQPKLSNGGVQSVLLQVAWTLQAFVPVFLNFQAMGLPWHWQQLHEAILCNQVSMMQSHSDT